MKYDSKYIEYQIFDESFRLIDKYGISVYENDLRNAFHHEYEYAQNNTEKGYLDWRHVIPVQLINCNGFGYIKAIENVGLLLSQAFINCNINDESEILSFYEIIRNVSGLIEFRKKDNVDSFRRNKNRAEKRKHAKVINAWIQFRDDFCKQLEEISETSSEDELSYSGSRERRSFINSIHDLRANEIDFDHHITETQDIFQPNFISYGISDKCNNEVKLDKPKEVKINIIRESQGNHIPEVICEQPSNSNSNLNECDNKNRIISTISKFVKRHKIPTILLSLFILFVFLSIEHLVNLFNKI